MVDYRYQFNEHIWTYCVLSEVDWFIVGVVVGLIISLLRQL